MDQRIPNIEMLFLFFENFSIVDIEFGKLCESTFLRDSKNGTKYVSFLNNLWMKLTGIKFSALKPAQVHSFIYVLVK